MAALCLASKIDLIQLSFLSCLAGGIVCEEVGVKPINNTKLLHEALKHEIMKVTKPYNTQASKKLMK